MSRGSPINEFSLRQFLLSYDTQSFQVYVDVRQMRRGLVNESPNIRACKHRNVVLYCVLSYDAFIFGDFSLGV